MTAKNAKCTDRYWRKKKSNETEFVKQTNGANRSEDKSAKIPQNQRENKTKIVSEKSMFFSRLMKLLTFWKIPQFFGSVRLVWIEFRPQAAGSADYTQIAGHASFHLN